MVSKPKSQNWHSSCNLIGSSPTYPTLLSYFLSPFNIISSSNTLRRFNRSRPRNTFYVRRWYSQSLYVSTSKFVLLDHSTLTRMCRFFHHLTKTPLKGSSLPQPKTKFNWNNPSSAGTPFQHQPSTSTPLHPSRSRVFVAITNPTDSGSNFHIAANSHSTRCHSKSHLLLLSLSFSSINWKIRRFCSANVKTFGEFNFKHRLAASSVTSMRIPFTCFQSKP